MFFYFFVIRIRFQVGYIQDMATSLEVQSDRLSITTACLSLCKFEIYFGLVFTTYRNLWVVRY